MGANYLLAVMQMAELNSLLERGYTYEQAVKIVFGK